MKFKLYLLSALWSAALFFDGCISVQAAAAFSDRAQPGFYQMRLGAYQITALSDGVNPLPAARVLTNVEGGALRVALEKDYLQDPVETSHNGFLLNTGRELILIDAGAGSLMGPSLGKLVANLRAAGYEPDQIDEVYITHMHPDHIGGLANGKERAFPNALVRSAKEEVDYWLSEANLATASGESRIRFLQAKAALEPYIAAKRTSVFEDGAELGPGIWALPTHGHTPGHTSFKVESAGNAMIIWGDIVHVSPLQFGSPGVALVFDYDAIAAVDQRAKMFKASAANGNWIAGAHLSFPGIGRIRKEAIGYSWIPKPYSP